MNVTTNKKIISDANYLIHDIVNGNHPLEGTLSRLKTRILSFLGGSLISHTTFLYAFDSWTDQKKLTLISTKKNELNELPLDAEDGKKAEIARNFQKDVYTNIENYTKNAQAIKKIAAVAAGCGSFELLRRARLSSFKAAQEERIPFVLGQLTLLSLIASCVHWIVAGRNLDRKNRALAEEANRQLNPSA